MYECMFQGQYNMCDSSCIKSKHFSMYLQTATVSPRITFVFWRMVGRSATTRTSLMSLAMMSLLDVWLSSTPVASAESLATTTR